MIHKNLKLFVAFEILLKFEFHLLVAPLYFEQILGSYLLAMSLFSVTLISCALGEVPMGLLSDMIGRKKTIIFGAFAKTISLIMFIIPAFFETPAYIIFFFASVLMGLSDALFSGTVTALIFETCKKHDNHNKIYAKYFSIATGWGRIAIAISCIMAGIISYYYGYVYAFALSAIFTFAASIVSLFYSDIKIICNKNSVWGSIRTHLSETFNLFKSNQTVRLLGYNKILEDSVSFRLDVIYFKTWLPEYLYGLPRTIKCIFEGLSFSYAPWVIKRIGAVKAMYYTNIHVLITKAVMMICNNFLSPYISTFVGLSSGPYDTSKSILLQNEYLDEQRATIDSILNVFTTIWTSILWIIVGAIMDFSSVYVALWFVLGFRLLRVFILKKLCQIKD